MAVIALPLPLSVKMASPPQSPPALPSLRKHAHHFVRPSVRPSVPRGNGKRGRERGRAVHFHGRLNKSSDGVCWFLDRGAAVAGRGGKREAARQGGENWLCSGGGLVLPLLRWYPTIDRGWVAVAGGPFGLGWTLRGERAKLQRDSLTPIVPKVPTLLMHYADREGRNRMTRMREERKGS